VFRSTNESVRTVLKTTATLGLLTAALPANVAVTVVALLRTAAVTSSREVNPQPRTVLVSGGKMTKSLQLARSFHAAGHRVILVESRKYRLTGHRFSRSVDRFYTVPRPDADDYGAALLRIVRDEHVDVYVPVCSPLASLYDARSKKMLSEYCEVLHLEPEMVEKLDDKYEFSVLAKSLGLGVPDTHRITAAGQVADFDFAQRDKRYILKSIAYDSVRRMDLTLLPRSTPAETAAFAADLPIRDDNPWILQEFVSGTEYCTHSTVRDGHIQVYCCCRSSASLLNYEAVDKPHIEAWVTRFVGALKLTGQVAFDFIEDADGKVYAIECNPRTHSAITMFYNHPDVARAYLESDVPVIRPLSSSRPTYWLYQELWRIISHPTTAVSRLRTIAAGKEAIFDWSDPLPFLMVHHAQIPSLLLQNVRRLRGWVKIDFNIGKLVESGGD
jgi:predicted ATP-grasp superfamily ATP-dependent carboligase